jgi:hypothetical protein
MRQALLRPAVLAVFISFGFAAGAAADQRDPSLPMLFKFLKSAKHSDQASLVEDKIWQIWSATGDPQLDKLMVSSSNAMERADYPAALEDIDRILKAKPFPGSSSISTRAPKWQAFAWALSSWLLPAC